MFLAIAVHTHLYKEYLRTQVSSCKCQYIYCKLSLDGYFLMTATGSHRQRKKH